VAIDDVGGSGTLERRSLAQPDLAWLGDTERIQTLRREKLGKCMATKAGRHFWVVLTTSEQASQGLRYFICRRCLKEAMEGLR
jgi:hypothetical protein